MCSALLRMALGFGHALSGILLDLFEQQTRPNATLTSVDVAFFVSEVRAHVLGTGALTTGIAIPDTGFFGALSDDG